MNPTLETPARHCPNCNSPLGNRIACECCGAIFDFGSPVSHFELLGLPQVFEIDNEQLSRAYRTAVRYVHPDRFADRSERERELATRMSARLNEAYQTLRDPVLRADYLLSLHGGPSAAEFREVPGSLLAEVMEIREKIDDAKSTDDSSSLDVLRETIAARRDTTLGEIGAHCVKLGFAPDECKRELRKLLNSMKYFDNLLNDLAGDPLAKSETAGAI